MSRSDPARPRRAAGELESDVLAELGGDLAGNTVQTILTRRWRKAR